MSVAYNKKYATLAEYLSLFAMTTLTAIAIYNKNISVFYILYLFWWDELLKTCFDGLKYFNKKLTLNSPKAYFKNVKTRLFFLMIYLVFIFVFFGMIMDWKSDDLVLNNFEVFLFKNSLFNLSLITFLGRELYLYFYEKNHVIGHHVLSRGIITLHLSIVLGILLWFFVAKKMNLLDSNASVLSILPFLLIKLYFEIQEIKLNQSSRLQA